MAKIFTFASKALGTVTNRGIAVFIGTQRFDVADIDAVFSQWIKKNPREETVVVVGCRKRILEAFEVDRDVGEGLERLGNNSDLRVFGFESNGAVSEISGDGSFIESDGDLILTDIVSSYIAQEIYEGEVIVPAPPGFWFEKLSERYASHFIRTEAMLKCTLAIELLALSVLPIFAAWRSGLSVARQSTVALYIDSMGIWPLAQKMIDLANADAEIAPVDCKIESFKSYEGLVDWSPRPIPSFVIISASTSGGLAERVAKKLGNKYFVCTVLGLEGDARHSQKSINPPEPKQGFFTIYRASRKLTGPASFNDLRADFIPGQASIPPGDEAIQIVGERFASRHAKPRLVRLLATSLSDASKRQLHELIRSGNGNQPVPVVVGKIKPDGVSRWPISFGLQDLRDSFLIPGGHEPDQSPLLNWLENFAPAGPVSIVYSSASGQAAFDVAQASRKMAEDVSATMTNLTGRDARVVSLDNLMDEYKRGEGFARHAFIVVSPVVGNGFIFKQASAVLRLIQRRGPRLFVCYATLPETASELRHLTSDLEMGPEGSSYKFLSKFKIPIGKLEYVTDWGAEVDLLESALSEQFDDSDGSREVLLDRISLIRSGAGLLGENVFLPSFTLEPMDLSNGFALWPTNEPTEGANLAGHVLLTIAAALEATRSSKARAVDSSLRAGIFQQAVLDPLTFTRYNDSAIQSAILRAAYPAELDYRSSPEASNDMSRLISKWADNASHRIGYALPEFVLAIGLRKLRLRQDDEKCVLQKTSALGGWLGALSKAVSRRLSA